MAECVECGEEYPDKRAELGYETCLECGAQEAHKQAVAKSDSPTIKETTSISLMVLTFLSLVRNNSLDNLRLCIMLYQRPNSERT